MTPHEITERPDAHKLSDVRGSITITNVSFEYNQKRVIANLSTEIVPGERIALVGPSGAGKSTIVKLISRMFDPNDGVIMIDGHDIRDVTLQSLKHAISNVPQDPVLFHRSLMENIRYGKPEATDAEVIAAAKLAHCHEFIMAHPQGYSALVGERGVKLSGGERQRVAIARAFLKNAPILILDEATSSLDSESEQLIQDGLMRLMEGRTTIVIAHRLSTIRRMDRILVLDQGQLVEDGSHEELLRTHGIYDKLWTLQQNGFIPNISDEGLKAA
jgi:ATP-binding cassette subfamily B protein